MNQSSSSNDSTSIDQLPVPQAPQAPQVPQEAGMGTISQQQLPQQYQQQQQQNIKLQMNDVQMQQQLPPHHQQYTPLPVQGQAQGQGQGQGYSSSFGNQGLSQEDINKIINGIQTASQQNLTSLPSRDVPRNISTIHQDPSVQPNYIEGGGGGGGGQEKLSNTNYIESMSTLEDTYSSIKKKQQQQQKNDELFDELQTPILIALLFFLFQMPIFNKTLYHYVPTLFVSDGNLGLSGFIVKSILFGALYIILMRTFNYLSVV